MLASLAAMQVAAGVEVSTACRTRFTLVSVQTRSIGAGANADIQRCGNLPL